MTVYLLTNTANGKVYVGQTIFSPEDRWKTHVWDSTNPSSITLTTALHNAIRKYGPSSFSLSTLSTATTLQELDQIEKHYIASYKSFPPELGYGYNMTPGGQGGGHYTPHTEEAKMKVGEANRGRKRTPEEMAKWMKAMKGRVPTPAHRLALSIANKGQIPWSKGKTLSEEHRKRISETKLANRERISESARKVWERPEYRAQQEKPKTQRDRDA